MTDKLIALIDGSIYSKSVCESAAWISLRTEAPVELLHVLGRREVASSDLSGSIALGARTALLEELSDLDEQRAKLAVKRGRALLEDAEAILRTAGVKEVTARLRHGDLLEAVSEAEPGSRGIVIGKRGEAADFAKLHLGSNLERIARAATKPVFVAARAFRPIERVLIAYDGGASALKAVNHVAQAPLFDGLAIKLLTVGSETPEVRSGLEGAQAVLKAGGRQVSLEIAQGQPEKVITDVVEKDSIDLLVMGAYGHSRIRSMIIGSTTAAMMQSCKIPVVLFR
ncbi:universal stress protein [Georhizobium profundi]|uniref:Universal stress protein n=1 Tax=Georhizobium profundi TaxID=2341112 RepID=A0A3S9B994_9HYPH|nr:universal stress protein [Georhizobium profundi]AZN73371.1 universal stress protein [Georhizobium profundi]